ncbi:MAG TPA: manganese catalase family protein [Acidobacteriota bacterium]|nr:manganese catalase family protein [Acidobacteriota bacterium]
MFLRIDKLQIELPKAKEADPNAAAAVQELLGGRFGEMSTLMNYMYQSFNFRGREKLRPYYDLIANIATEELGHIELVSASVNLLLNGPRGASTDGADPVAAPLEAAKDFRNTHHFIFSGQSTMVGNSLGQAWRGDYVFSSGNLILDLLHNFFLELGARTHKLRVYEMTRNPAAREMIGYLLVRGGVHALAYGKALETLTGTNITKMLPVPKIDNSKFPESRKFEANGNHRRLYRFSPNDYKELGVIWSGPAPTGDGDLEVVDGPPPGGPLPDLGDIPESFAPEFHPAELYEIAQKLYSRAT